MTVPCRQGPIKWQQTCTLDNTHTQTHIRYNKIHVQLLAFQGLQYIHSMQLVHLDIKPENIFITFPESTTPMDIVCSELTTAEEQYISPLPVYKIGKEL